MKYKLKNEPRKKQEEIDNKQLAIMLKEAGCFNAKILIVDPNTGTWKESNDLQLAIPIFTDDDEEIFRLGFDNIYLSCRGSEHYEKEEIDYYFGPICIYKLDPKDELMYMTNHEIAKILTLIWEDYGVEKIGELSCPVIRIPVIKSINSQDISKESDYGKEEMINAGRSGK